MVVVDKTSFIKRLDFETLDKVVNAKYNSLSPSIFVNLRLVFGGDFCQLKPSNIFWNPLYTYKDCGLWYKGVKKNLELKTNHNIFKNNEQWGKILERYRSEGSFEKDIESINKLLVEKKIFNRK